MLTIQDCKTIIKLLAAVWLLLAFLIFLRELAGSLTVNAWDYAALADLRHSTLNTWLPWLVLSPLLALLIKRFPFLPDRWAASLIIHLGLAMGFIIVHLAAAAYYFHFFEPDKDEAMLGYAGWEHMGHILVTAPFVLTDFMIYALFVISFNFSRYIQLVRQKEQDASHMEANLTAAKLHALQMQINPHFLFNALNSISVLVQKKDVETAGEMIHQLSDFFRMTLEKSVHQLVPLETELELARHYLSIEQIRFKDRLKIIMDIDPRTLLATVPALILQPLVENSLRHGINASEHQGTITLRSRQLADRLLLEVIDNGSGCDPAILDHPRGIGLKNVKDRLQQAYNGDCVFRVRSEPGKGVTISMEVPAVHPSVASDAQQTPDFTPLQPREV